MKYITKHITIVFLMTCIACMIACSDDEEGGGMKGQFEVEVTPGIYSGNIPVLQFNADEHQMAFTAKSWRIQTDDQSVYLSCSFSERPMKGKTLTADVRSRGMDNVVDGEQEAVILKSEKGKYWVWFPDAEVGILIQLNNRIN